MVITSPLLYSSPKAGLIYLGSNENTKAKMQSQTR